MLVDFSNVQNISFAVVLICVVESMDWREKKNRYKALYWDRDGFILLYKRIENGNLQWPRNQEEVKKLTNQELR